MYKENNLYWGVKSCYQDIFPFIWISFLHKLYRRREREKKTEGTFLPKQNTEKSSWRLARSSDTSFRGYT